MKPAIIRRLHKILRTTFTYRMAPEFWLARDLQKLPGYDEWRNFFRIIEKAQESCKTANNPVLDHFVDTNKSIPVPKGGNG